MQNTVILKCLMETNFLSLVDCLEELHNILCTLFPYFFFFFCQFLSIILSVTFFLDLLNNSRLYSVSICFIVLTGRRRLVSSANK